MQRWRRVPHPPDLKRDVCFNSLFEMPSGAKPLVRESRGCCFNSLFEMHLFCYLHVVVNVYVVSILYLRC